MSDTDAFLQRLDVVQARLAALAAQPAEAERLTGADPRTGEQWDGGQVWAHMAEFITYWIGQVRHVLAACDAEPVAFGRVSTDAGRLNAIARDRTQPVSVLWSGVHADIELLRAFLDGLDTDAWTARGVHATRGVMTMPQMIDEFLVGHLEQHADQLESLATQQ